MLHVGVEITFDHVKAVLAASVAELERNQEKIENPGVKDDVEQIVVKYHYIFLSPSLFKYPLIMAVETIFLIFTLKGESLFL